MQENNRDFEKSSEEIEKNSNSSLKKKQAINPTLIVIIAVLTVAVVLLLVILLGGNSNNNSGGNSGDNSSDSSGDNSGGSSNEGDHTHSFGAWEIQNEATYSEKGSEIRRCSCGAEESREIPKKESETISLTALECYAELRAFYDNTKNQDSATYYESHEEENTVRGVSEITIYYDGNEYYIYSRYGKADPDWEEREDWCGKVGNEYVLISHVTKGETTTSKSYDIVTEDYFLNILSNCRDDMFSHLDDLLGGTELVENDAECIKITGDVTNYIIKVPNNSGYGEEYYIFEIKVQDECIVELVNCGYSIYYPQDRVVTMPDISGYEKK